VSFDEVVKKAKKEWAELTGGNVPLLFLGEATCGRSAGAGSVETALRQALDVHKIQGRIIKVGCIGLCYAEPIVMVTKPGMPGICYGNVNGDTAAKIVREYIEKGNPLPEIALGTVGEGRVDGIPNLLEIPVLKPQVRRILKNCGFIDPTDINHYLAHDGYQGLAKALKMKPEQVLDEVKKSGLRGRGGAGFPTWKKWEFCRNAKGDAKYVICNADEGDPGAFMNRSLLEGDPHSVLEGMLIAGYAIGAREGYVYCRAEYPLALERLRIAMKQMKEHNFIGEDILGSGFSFKIKIKEGAGAFVCGEETALIASIEGKRGMPRPRPPFPAVSGLWGKPTIINNVESLACAALILRNGAEWFARYGTERSKGTKTLALVGKVKCTGLVEVPLGIPLRELIFGIGGGIIGDKMFKAVQTGGPSGGCLPENLLDSPVDYESLTSAGTIMGSGGVVVMDETTCMVDIAKYFLNFTRKESCGECVPCRLGTKQMYDILDEITQGKGREGDIDLLMDLATGIKKGSLCGLGQTAPNPLLTTLRYFRDEYEAHIRDKKCPAGVCKPLIHYRINPDKCKACLLCAKHCPAEAISGEKKKPQVIDQIKCLKCGICRETCPDKFSAVECIPGGAPELIPSKADSHLPEGGGRL
jgi:NADH-quinone oxidoreductase subunit F